MTTNDQNNELDYGGGVILSPNDERDYKIDSAMEFPVGASKTDDLDLPDEYEVWTPPVGSQGSTASCVAQTYSSILECIDHLNGLEHRNYSVAFIYGNRRYKNDHIGAGMIPRNAAANLVEYGDVYSSVWDDTRGWYKVIDEFESRYDSIKQYADKPISKYIMVYESISDIKAFIYKYKIPVAICAETKYFDKGTSGSHMVIAYGWTKDNKLKYQNSWGIYKPKGTISFHSLQEARALVPHDIYFTDVTPDSWAYDDIILASYRGIMMGYVDGTFRPEDKITRQEMAVICGRLIKEIKKSFKTKEK